MKISKETLDILKAFSNINTNLLIKPGKKISTMSAGKDIMAEVEVAEKFDKEAGIFNLNELLGVVSLFNAPEVTFEDKYLEIAEGKVKTKYVYADASLLTVPTKSIQMPTPEIEFELTADNLSKILKASAALSVGDIAVVGDGKAVSIKVLDVKNPTSNSYSVDLDTATTETFEVYFKVEKLKLIGGDYDVEISSKKISKFSHKTIKLVVYIAVESNSTFA
jgi:hypothetical protein